MKTLTQTVALVAYPLHTLQAVGFRTNAGFKLCMVGETNRDYQVLANNDLNTTNWPAIGVMENTNGIRRYFDPTTTNQTHRYYRAKQLP